MHWIILTPEQAEIAAYRFQEHGNSAVRIARYYRRLSDQPRLRLCRAIRRLERRFAINLGTVCYKFLEKETRPTPAVQQRVMDYVAHWRDREDGTRDLAVSVDRVREVDRLAEGHPEWASSRGS
ncbi:MAG TPA: hypothetical protein VM737_07750 [Gemmatimonadota bacterium]|nr:hypothetical protein [Gemmatimonadota bacterium]